MCASVCACACLSGVLRLFQNFLGNISLGYVPPPNRQKKTEFFSIYRYLVYLVEVCSDVLNSKSSPHLMLYFVNIYVENVYVILDVSLRKIDQNDSY